MFVRSAPGALVRDPATGEPLPESGRKVPRDEYWMRRLADGDLILTAPGGPGAGRHRKGS